MPAEVGMPSRIVFCADGTWDGSPNNTNVYQMSKACVQSSDQVVFYDDGVGADGLPLERIIGGAFGFGLWSKIKQGYAQIAHVYEKDNSIFIFGFSRGAYTARSLAGMIAVCGLPLGGFDDDLVEKAFAAYRERDMNERQQMLGPLTDKYQLYDAPITMVGVWDTVGALGIPSAFGGVDPALYGFLDTGLHSDVKNAYHAVSIDERRAEFPATLWTAKASTTVMEQIYFAGVHCDVGGSYPEHGLADITLSWMMNKACAIAMPDQKPGLLLDPGVWAKFQCVNPEHALDQKHESWSPLWGFPRERSIDIKACLSDSVQLRCQHDGTYRPKSLSFDANGNAAASYSIVKVLCDAAAAGNAG
jgi:uncharacterized protein (DUF2235 family)